MRTTIRYRGERVAEAGVWVGVSAFLAVLGLWVTAVAGWITHVVWGVHVLLATDPPSTTGQMLFAVLGTLVAPPGTVHGVGLWFGLFAW